MLADHFPFLVGWLELALSQNGMDPVSVLGRIRFLVQTLLLHLFHRDGVGFMGLILPVHVKLKFGREGTNGLFDDSFTSGQSHCQPSKQW